MRIAVLSTIEDLPPPGRRPAAFARFAGARVIERQLDLAVAMGCERIACFVDTVGDEIIALQHRAERAGARFVALRDPRPLAGMVTAGDEVLVQTAGVLPDSAIVARHLANPAILAFPADPAVNQGYERIDAELAWSGVMLGRGATVEHLLALPADADVPSALMRIALQQGTRVVPLEKRLIDEGAWLLRAEPTALAEREKRWIRDNTAMAPFTAPGLAVCQRIGARLAQDVLGKRGERMGWALAAIAGVIALALALADRPAIGLGSAALMAMIAAIAASIDRIGHAGQLNPRAPLVSRLVHAAIDPVLMVSVALASPPETSWLRWFVPLVLIGILRLGERIAAPPWRDTFADRVTLSLVIAPLALLGFAQVVAAAVALLSLLALFFVRDQRS